MGSIVSLLVHEQNPWLQLKYPSSDGLHRNPNLVRSQVFQPLPLHINEVIVDLAWNPPFIQLYSFDYNIL